MFSKPVVAAERGRGRGKKRKKRGVKGGKE